MALDSAIYLVTREIAMRSGTINSRYRIADGRFVLSNKDLAMIRFTSEEYLTGLQGVERVDERDAQRLIAENNFQRGLVNATTVVQEQEQEPQEQVEEQVEQQGDDTETETETPQDEPDVVDGEQAYVEQVENENNEQEQVEEE